MDITGIICEYNPLHLGHKKQLATIKADHPGTGIVCLMSGNYVQRGAPAIVDKSLRAKAALPPCFTRVRRLAAARRWTGD